MKLLPDIFFKISLVISCLTLTGCPVGPDPGPPYIPEIVNLWSRLDETDTYLRFNEDNTGEVFRWSTDRTILHGTFYYTFYLDNDLKDESYHAGNGGILIIHNQPDQPNKDVDMYRINCITYDGLTITWAKDISNLYETAEYSEEYDLKICSDTSEEDINTENGEIKFRKDTSKSLAEFLSWTFYITESSDIWRIINLNPDDYASGDINDQSL